MLTDWRVQINLSILCAGLFQLKVLENASWGCAQEIGTKVHLW